MSALAPSSDTYEEIPYQGKAITLTHPCRLAMVARLSGLTPPPPARSRVLELGCAVGTNLLPMAENLPGSRFVGVDRSPRQIEEGRSMARQAGLANVELVHADILEIDDRLGRFDYIVCHGVYSWVPRDVQQHLLNLGTRLLSPDGLMYVSYNTYPGWHLRGAVREMMLWHVAEVPMARDKVERSRGLIEFLAAAAMPLRPSYGALLKEELEAVRASDDYYLCHEQLEASNEPVYFNEFVRRAEQAGLVYVSDADITTMFAQHFDAATAERLLEVPLLRREQYMDFLRGRVFRASILRRPGAVLNTAPQPTWLAPLSLRMAAPFERSATTAAGAVWKHGSGSFEAGPAATAAFTVMRARWPAWVPVAELADTAAAGQAVTGSAPQQLFDELLAALSRGAIVAADTPPPVGAKPAAEPCCTPLARLQAARSPWVVNRLHESVRLDPLARLLVQWLDGARGRGELAAMVGQAVLRGDIVVARSDGVVGRPDHRACAEMVERGIGLLAQAAFFAD